MFEEIIRELKRLAQRHQISVSVPLDEEGYFDRACPASKCGGHFKVLFEDWTNKVPDARAFCPFCRHESPADDWDTADQQRYFEEVAHAEMDRLLDGALRRAVAQTRPKRIRGGLFDVTMKLSYTPGRSPAVIPARAREELRQQFTCEACGCHYASLGASFFCPACGHNSAVSCFDNTLETVRKTLTALPAMQAAVEQATDVDTATDTTRQVREDQFPRLIGAFERLNEALFEKLPNASQFPRRGSVFQRLDDASALWQRASGKGYNDFTSAGGLQRLKLLFERRHVLSHRQGIVDQRYIDRSGDRSYTVGQRLIVRDRDVLELVELLAKVAVGLRSLV